MTTDERTRPRKRADHGGPLGRLQLELALSAGKLAGGTGRLLRLGGGTSLPGLVARRIDPDVLRKVVGASAARKVVVSGSNGKTTTCRMLAALAHGAGRRVMQNRAGSNLIQGVTSLAVNGADLLGRVDADTLILEIDEATLRHVVAEIEPDTFILTNIFRDQLDRFGELYAVAKVLEDMVRALPAGATAVLNGDDPMIASFAPDARARRLYFGLDAPEVARERPEHGADTIRCVFCQHDLVYSRAYISHLGAFRCPNCGYARPQLDVAVTRVEMSPMGATEITLQTPAGPLELRLPLPGLHNVYNAAAAVAAGLALGIDPAAMPAAFAGLRPAFGRLEEIAATDKRIVLSFVKNPISYNTTLRTIMQQPGPKHVLCAHSNTLVDGEDFAWLWDIDLESLAPHLASLVVSGSKAGELALRYKYAGVPEDQARTIPALGTALDAALANVESGGTLHVLAGYTPTRELRRIMEQRGWVPPFWEE